MEITYAITVHNELDELQRLMGILLPNIPAQDEIVIQYDEPKAPPPILNYLQALSAAHPFIKIVSYALKNDFADFKNNLSKHSTGDFIFQIDADEFPSDYLISILHKTIEDYPDINVLVVPRINMVEGITESHLQAWNWTINDFGWINFPDFQDRIYRNIPSIRWEGPVHERLISHGFRATLGAKPEFALFHPKSIARQERQVRFYDAVQKPG